MKKKVISVVLTLTLAVSMLSGCNVSMNGVTQSAEDMLTAIDEIKDRADELQKDESAEAEDDDASAEESAKEEADTEEDSVEISADKVEQLTKIAEANGISYEDLNVKFNDEGYVTFLGHSYCDEEINDEDDALLSLESISDLIGLDGVSLDFYRTDTSKISGNTYYTFYQVSETEINGQTIPAEFYNNLVKVAVDKNKKTAAVSTYLNHGEIDEINPEDILTTDEVNEYVKTNLVLDPDSVIEDATKLIYWDDAITSENVNSGKESLCYLVYVKNDDEIDLPEDDDELFMETGAESDNDEEDDIEGSKFQAVVVSALKDYTDESKEDYSVKIVTMFACSSTGEQSLNNFTSLYFFEGREDAGEYTYTLSTDWIKDVYKEYDGPETMEVTVPVIYDESTELYYLADYNRRIVMGNYDNIMTGSFTGDDNDINPVVTKTPDDVSSWGFLNAPAEDSGIDEYFFDSNYVLAVYNNMMTIYDMFHNRYGLNGVDANGYPILSALYTYDESYPEKIMDFQYNASCAGPINDWVLVCTSPRLAAGISPTVMGHEFTHGVNQQLTSSQYFNQPGAMMESYADVIGEELAILYADDPIHEPWMIGGDYCDVMRDFADPKKLYYPMYINGDNYVQPTVSEFGEYLDQGGVHINSSVSNHLCYMLTHDDAVTLQDGEEIFDIGTNVDMWFETLFLATYITDFNDLAHFLTYTSTVTGANDGQRELLARLLKEQGYFGDCEEYEQLLESEDSYEISYSFDTDKDDFNDRYEMCVRNVVVKDDNKTTWIPGAMIPEDGQLTVRISSSVKLDPKIYILDKETGEVIDGSGVMFVTTENAIEDNNVICHIKEISLTSDANDKFTIPEGENITQISSDAATNYANTLYIDREASFTKYGKYIVVTQSEETGEFNLYLITVAD